MLGRWAAAALLALAGCSAEVTEIVLEVDSDLSVPTALDRVRIEVARPEAMEQLAEADLTAPGGALPRTLTLVHRGGALGPIAVRVAGLKAGAEVVSRRLDVSFEQGRSLRLRVFLGDACTERDCPADLTCEAGACRPVAVASCEYVGRECGDAGVPDADSSDAGAADACVTRTEECNGADDDCDGRVDEDFDLGTDPDNCGVCGRSCAAVADHATGSECAAGACVLVCDPGWGDCNRDGADGCETDLDSTMEHCGACGSFCPRSGTFHTMDGVCAGGRCLLSCDGDWGDCDSDPATGCETHVTVDNDHCGTCDNPCPTGQMCRSSVCS